MRYHAPEKVGDPRPEIDSTSYRDWMTSRVFAATPTDTLAVAGYVRRLENGGAVYDAPSADALLDDRFLQTHCFGVVGAPKGHDAWIGIAFTPRATRDGVVDVAGVLWLDRSTAELRRLEFTYANLPSESYRLCTVPGHTGDSICQSFVEKGLNRFGTGGDADFERLSSGEWLVKRLTIYTISSEYVMRPSSRTLRANMGDRCLPEQVVVKQFPKLGDCIYLNWMVPRLSIVSTTALRILRDGEEIYDDGSSRVAAEQFMRRQAGRQPVGLTGAVTDNAGRPLRSVIVQVEQPARRAALTDSLGGFRIPWLPPGEVVVSFQCAGYETVRAALPLSADSTRRVSLVLQQSADAPPPTRSCASSN